MITSHIQCKLMVGCIDGNTHHLTRRYPQVDENPVESDREDDPIGDIPTKNT